MDKANEEKFKNKWLSVPILATITRLLCRELTLQNEGLAAYSPLMLLGTSSKRFQAQESEANLSTWRFQHWKIGA